MKPDPKVRQDIDELQDEFDDILVLAQESFVLRAVPLKKFRLSVTSLCVNQKQNIPMFNQSMLEVIEKSSCDEIFSFLTRMEVWDFLNFRVLQKIVKSFTQMMTRSAEESVNMLPKLRNSRKKQICEITSEFEPVVPLQSQATRLSWSRLTENTTCSPWPILPRKKSF